MIDQAKLVAACRQLVALVDNSQSGLATWHSMCVRQVDAIRGALGVGDDIERARVVGVLDAWAGEYPRFRRLSLELTGNTWRILFSEGGTNPRSYYFWSEGPTPDAARAAAAKAIEAGEV